jgi:hypothetical protein
MSPILIHPPLSISKCANKIVNTIRVLCEEVKETIIVQKVLKSLTSIFDPNISAIE